MEERYMQARQRIRALGEQSPERMDGFHTMLMAIEKEGALDRKQKELIAVALAVSRQSEWCLAYHTKQAILAGATDEEIVEAAWMAVLLGGGPALMQAASVLDIVQEIRRKK